MLGVRRCSLPQHDPRAVVVVVFVVIGLVLVVVVVGLVGVVCRVVIVVAAAVVVAGLVLVVLVVFSGAAWRNRNVRIAPFKVRVASVADGGIVTL